MYIEILMPRNITQWNHYQGQLRHELRKWCYQHGLDYWSINIRAVDDHLQLELPSTKAYELFCVSWRPELADLREYRLIRNS